MPATALIWFRRDLRLQDNAAVMAALADNAPILPVYIHDDGLETRSLGAASRWWLDRSLKVLDEEIKARGSRLILRSGDAGLVLPALCRDYGVRTVYASRTFDSACDDKDREIAHELKSHQIDLKLCDGHLLTAPGMQTTQDGKPFRVFTPFLKHLDKQGLLDIDAMPDLSDAIWPQPEIWPESQSLADLGLAPALTPSGQDWTAQFDRFTPGERGARKALRRFLREGRHYADRRDRPDEDMTSHLSPHLRFGEISPRRVLLELSRCEALTPDDVGKFRAELVWRDFGYNLLHQQARLHDRNFRRDFDHFPWRSDEAGLRAWRKGKTGYDLVDAGMMELWRTGYMHNRVRMVCASFLVKHLLIDWRDGEAWFWDCLLDADPASNPANWQWGAGCGADAAPYFRIFNPISQASRFDPAGLYRARWLGGDPSAYVAADKAGRPNADPQRSPIVKHDEARQRALNAFYEREQDHEPD